LPDECWEDAAVIPPRCHVCGLDLFDVPDDGRKHFILVYFGETADAKRYYSRQMAELGREGHPNNAIWFCTEHADLARQHENMETGAALRAIDAAIGRTRRAQPGG
jgi:hypothetical protein